MSHRRLSPLSRSLALALALALVAGCTTTATSGDAVKQSQTAPSDQYVSVTQLGSRIPRRVKKSEADAATRDGAAIVDQMREDQMARGMPDVDR